MTVRAGQKLGKYRLLRRIANGPFASVYEAADTLEGIRVALKLPHPEIHANPQFEADFRKEVRITAKLQHANILSVKDASFIGDQFVIASALGQSSLHDRLKHRLSLKKAVDFSRQMLDAVAHAHSLRIIHCDIKPANFIVFPQDRLRLADFGIAKVAMHTVKASGSGTLGYVAPEQAMGRPSFRSDVFSLALVIYRMLSGHLPEWPFDWPPEGLERIRGRMSPEFIGFLRRALEVRPNKRPRDASRMRDDFRRLEARAIKRPRTRRGATTSNGSKRSWQQIRHQQFTREYGKALETRFECNRCHGPVAEAMHACPWCGAHHKHFEGDSKFPAQCPRCARGVKLDWKYCAWCYGAGFEEVATRAYSDKRYVARCSCADRGPLMRFMRYCPWCRTKVRKKWPINGNRQRCPHCRWGVIRNFWSWCPWCTRKLSQ